MTVNTDLAIGHRMSLRWTVLRTLHQAEDMAHRVVAALPGGCWPRWR